MQFTDSANEMFKAPVLSLFGNILVFLVPAAFPVDECPTILIEDEEEEVCTFEPYKPSL
jgi:hypothetical protein